MHWIGPLEKASSNGALEKRLGDVVVQLRGLILDEIGNLPHQIQNFSRPYGLLLPRLLSGQLDFAPE